MRTKIKAEKLSKPNGLSRSFVYKCLPSALPQTRSKNKQSYKTQLSRIFQHSLTVQMKNPVRSQCDIIGTASFPLQFYILQHLDRCTSVDIFFSLHGHACFYGKLPNNEHQRLEVLMSAHLVSTFYGLSSSNLVLFGRIEDDKLVIDVMLNPSLIWNQLHFKPTCTSEAQFHKIMSFLKWSGSMIREERRHRREKIKDLLSPSSYQSSENCEELSLPVLSHDVESSEEFKKSLECIYELVQESNIWNAHKWNDQSIPQPSAIKATLHPYQLDAVRWMIYRESDTSKEVVDPTWFSSYFLQFNENLFFSTVTGSFSRSLPTDLGKPCRGGILADEMGLGKTLEVLSLILHRPYPEDMTVKPLECLEKRSYSQKTFLFKVPPENFESGEGVKDKPMERDDNDDIMSISSTASTLLHSVFCVCGANDFCISYNDSAPIHCDVCDCGFYQHAECVSYNPIVSFGGNSYEVNYICPLCWKNLRVHSKATLIVTPDHILSQWKDEIEKHVDISSNLCFMLYYGMNCSKARYYQPVDLATKDVVITTYSVLKRELSFAEATQERISRKSTRYLQPPSPLKCIKWWRICIDEAQMAESVTSKIAKMLCEVDAVHRWCITGTPAETRLSDFYGLLTYLRVEPFTSQHYWNVLLYQPFLQTLRRSGPNSEELTSTMLVRLLSNLLFRNTKTRVSAQLALPPIKTKFHLIKFTPAEQYIYRKILRECSKAIEQALIKWPNLNLTVPMTSHPYDFQSRILASVTRARQACTHPSLVITSSRGGKKRLVESDPNETRLTLQLARTKKIHSMTEVLRRVGNDEQVQCENLLRSWTSNKTEAAACYIIKEEYEQAANCYRAVLKKVHELESNFEIRADSCQILHAITNLHFLIENRHVALEKDPICPSSTTPMECDDSGLGPSDHEECGHSTINPEQLDPRVDRDLPQKANLIRRNYLKRRSHKLGKCYERLKPLEPRLDELFSMPSGFPANLPQQEPWLTWLRRSFELLASTSIFNQLPDLLVTALQGRSSYNFEISQELMDARSGQQFQNLVLKSTGAAFEARKAMLKALEQVHKIWFQFSDDKEIDTSVLQEYARCCGRRNTCDTLHYRTEIDAHIRCAYCTALQTLRDYRRILNQETPKNNRNLNVNGDEDWVEDITYGDQIATVETNPLNCALSVVATQVGKLRDAEPWVKTMAHSLPNLLTLLSNELSCLGKIMAHTQEWWDAYHDTQQFAIRLQSSRPDESAFILLEEVESRLEQSSSNEPGNRKALEDHLRKLQFIRSQHKEHLKESTTMCPVCMEYLSPSLRRFFIIIAGCWHCLCEPCFDENRKTSSVCPVCRNSIDRTLSNKNDYLIHWSGVSTYDDSQDQDPSNAIHIKGDHSSKVNEVLRCLLRLKSEDPAAKVVVFSSWTSILLTIEEALRDNGIPCSHFLQPHDQGLRDFKSPDTEFWVLLIPFSLGANGLNITEANHVILVDPVLNPGKERQAIARLHRIGQTRPCTVHKFMVDESIEMMIMNQSALSNASNFTRTNSNQVEVLQMSIAELIEIVSGRQRQEEEATNLLVPNPILLPF